MFGSFDNFRVKGNANSKRSIAECKFISPLQVVFWELNLSSFFGSLISFSLTDFFAVNKSAIFATEIAHPDIGRIDIQQAVIAGNRAVFFVVGNLRIAIFGAANNASCAGVKGKFSAFEIPGSDGEGNF